MLIVCYSNVTEQGRLGSRPQEAHAADEPLVYCRAAEPAKLQGQQCDTGRAENGGARFRGSPANSAPLRAPERRALRHFCGGPHDLSYVPNDFGGESHFEAAAKADEREAAGRDEEGRGGDDALSVQLAGVFAGFVSDGDLIIIVIMLRVSNY